jgi:hypothetical protein
MEDVIKMRAALESSIYKRLKVEAAIRDAGINETLNALLDAALPEIDDNRTVVYGPMGVTSLNGDTLLT